MGIIGPTGGGKTTLFNVLGGFSTYDVKPSVNIKINGNVVTNYSNLLPFIEYKSQFIPFMDNLTVLETLKYFIRIENGDITNINQYVYPLGLKSILNNKVSRISAGEKARLLIVLSLCSDKPVIILDEPLSPLDSYQAKFIIDRLKEKAKMGKTIIISIHQPNCEILSALDKLYIIAESKLIYFGEFKNTRKHFEEAGFALDSHNNLSESILSLISVFEGDKASTKILKTLVDFQQTVEESKKNTPIPRKPIPGLLNCRNIFWYVFYLYLSSSRESLANLFKLLTSLPFWVEILFLNVFPLCRSYFKSN